MVIIGERLNSTRTSVKQALDRRDGKYLVSEAQEQEKAGANYIDLNTATLLEKEVEALRWAITLLQKKLNIPLSIDTPNAEAMEEGLKVHKGQALLNSLSGESRRIKAFLPLIKEYKPRVVVLCLDDEGLPKSADKELSIAEKMVSFLDKEGVNPQDIFVDPLVRPVAVDQEAGILFLNSLQKIKKSLPQVKTIAGLSNVSFGLPRRKLLNRAFLMLALKSGLDAAILDPLDKDIFAALSSTRALLGQDPGLRNYLSSVRSRKF